jgi:hypothetical protein
LSATEGIWRVTSSRNLARHWPIAQVAAASVLFALGLGVFLLTRRTSGALIAPLPPWQLVFTAASLVAWSWFVRLSWTTTIWPSVLANLLFAIACSYPGQRLIDWLVWLPAIGAIFAPPKRISLVRRRRPAEPRPSAIENESDGGQLLQELRRYRGGDGRETVRGMLLAEFSPGERSATLFVAFCPPFEQLPNVDVDVADDSAIVNKAQVLHHGTQIEVRLRSPSACKQNVIVELFASEPAAAV